MDITLADLLIIEPRLSLMVAPPCAGELRNLGQCEVSWAVSVRATPPHLPVLRGGELVLVPDRIAAALGPDLAVLLREAAIRQASAAVVAGASVSPSDGAADAGAMQLMAWQGDLTPEAEASVNRLLAECRGELYRAGSELERHIAELGSNRVGVGPLIRTVSEMLAFAVAVTDSHGRELASITGPRQQESDFADSLAPIYEVRELPSGARVRLGPLYARQRIVARYLAPRITAAAEAALQRDDDARPRGSHRVAATGALLAGSSGHVNDQRLAALALGLDPDATFIVAVCSGGTEATIARALAPLGAVLPAGAKAGQRDSLVAVNGPVAHQSLAHRVLKVKKRWEIDHATDGAVLALSAPAIGVASIPGAARESRFVAALQARTALAKRAASFGSVDDVGALSLLYQLRESSELRHFVAETLGQLEQRDSRGTLLATLRAFLESGGSQVDASQRLGIHRNTLAYRLRRIGELVGRDIAEPGSWLTLHLALRASDMLRALADGG